MLSLPTELWLLIGAHLSKRDLLAAIQVNHTFYSQLIPILYRNFVICGSHGGSAGPPWRNTYTTRSKPRAPSKTPYVERSFATIERLKMVQCSSTLMGAIKSCTLCHFDHQNRQNEKTTADALKQVLQESVAFISTLPHCRDIVIDSVHMNNCQLKQLISHHSLPTNLSIRALTILDDDFTHVFDSQQQCPLKNLTINEVGGSEQSVREFAEWSMNRDLQSFSVRSIGPNHFPLFRIQFAQKSFPNLRRLELIGGPTSTEVLAHLSVLEELSLPFTSPPLVLPPTILPRLRTFQGSGDQARSIIPGRPIRVLHIPVGFRGLLPSSVGDEVPNFGSTTSILELSVKGGTPAEVIGHGRIARLCPSLQVLCLHPISTIKIDAVSVSSTFEKQAHREGRIHSRRSICTSFIIWCTFGTSISNSSVTPPQIARWLGNVRCAKRFGRVRLRISTTFP
jgi:hypothetical protein